jgi:N-acetylglucosaminyldiphosphoundecaprenol N-acetyl-beta-D-mannosaminyltransferase
MYQQRSKFLLDGVKVDALRIDQLHAYIAEAIREKYQRIILNVNANAITIAHKDGDFKSLLNDSDLVFCDGFGVLLAARILGYHIPQRITYADWIYKLCEFCQANHFSLFLLGGTGEVVHKAEINLKSRFPQLIISGIHHGYFNKVGPQNDEVVAFINKVSPDILLVCFGMPLQEYWIRDNKKRLNVHVMLAGGACLDYVSRRIPRGPRWMVDNGLEWLARLIIEPHRLWKRYTAGNLKYLLIIIKEIIHKKK